ncbi:hypothetical protein TARUN_5101 [Trichoderma arundinaceum]|uniref:Uncharacterized protein n=1 Tax=Trichoderma arundinaceum TaxID=490622 RepID=A0A395NM24_TRIAR|nr:hypothetical protein TARUN_5101 [Trichoderma arundinaceum]
MSENLIEQDEAVLALLAYAFSGAIGPVEGRGVSYALIDASSSRFSWSVAVEDIDGPAVPVDRYLIKIDRLSKRIDPPELIDGGTLRGNLCCNWSEFGFFDKIH